ncbi:hypothetical protein OESDEN_03145 [Oesophagostomum dentatum]|uniref:Uncharacterized protein n=1 Tax=Oesophagostomum dentatum TaxID=61180 RepID=A0A0B1TH48_OESDE|nr:hypothetical protein OESDEN_03145 [Oesophagostomum dentatum]
MGTYSRLFAEMVLAVEACLEGTTSKASGSSEVRCEQKEVNGTTDGLLDELKAEFESLSTLTDFNRAGSDVKPISASRDRIVCEMVVGPGHINAKASGI